MNLGTVLNYIILNPLNHHQPAVVIIITTTIFSNNFDILPYFLYFSFVQDFLNNLIFFIIIFNNTMFIYIITFIST